MRTQRPNPPRPGLPPGASGKSPRAAGAHDFYPAPRAAPRMAFEREVELEGHLVDSLILTRVFEAIIEAGADFEVREIRIGRRKSDSSYARLSVRAETREKLDGIIYSVSREGAVPSDHGEASVKPAPRDMVLPEGFYSTTNNRTDVFVRGRWTEVEGMMMDKCVVVSGRRARCAPIREVRRGDMVVVGEAGVRVSPPERPREAGGIFEFMSSSSSSERPTRKMASRVARDMAGIARAGGRIVLVGGPAIVHTGAAPCVASMVKSGYIHGVLAGNALAVHDIERALMGTSLGMNADGTLAPHGHRHHMYAINEVFRSGSIPKMVRSGKLRSGIMYECVRKKVPFVLAPSIRDDGPLPDVVTEITEAQRRYKKVLKGASMVLMVSTMLHSIAVGNMIPADVKVVVIDINQPTVTKLMDRGTWQALGVVTDAGAFLPAVAEELGC